jgi:hypothetical protein
MPVQGGTGTVTLIYDGLGNALAPIGFPGTYGWSLTTPNGAVPSGTSAPSGATVASFTVVVNSPTSADVTVPYDATPGSYTITVGVRCDYDGTPMANGPVLRFFSNYFFVTASTGGGTGGGGGEDPPPDPDPDPEPDPDVVPPIPLTPDAPTTTTTPYVCEGRRVTISWENDPVATFYNVYVYGVLAAVTPGTSVTLTDVPIGTPLQVTVKAGNVSGLSPASGILVVTPCSLAQSPDGCGGVIGTWNSDCGESVGEWSGS